MTNFQKEVQQYFDETETIDLDPKEKEKLKNLVKLNASSRKISISKRITAVACAICLLILAIIPTIAIFYKDDSAPPMVYYTSEEAVKINLTEQEAKDIISNGYSKYEFIFDEFTFTSLVGFYTPNEENKLLAIQIVAQEIVAPYTLIEMNLVVSEQFIFSNQSFYITNSAYIKTNNYELYKKENLDIFDEYMYGYLIFKNHKLYLYLNMVNETLFNKFI